MIVDAPATGHGVGFLQTPRTFANIARVGPIRQQAETLDAFIRDRKRTGIAVVALPEEMPVNETAMLERDLASEVGVSVDRIFCNGLYPERFDERETELIAARGRGRDRHGAQRLPRRAHARAGAPARSASSSRGWRRSARRP